LQVVFLLLGAILLNEACGRGQSVIGHEVQDGRFGRIGVPVSVRVVNTK
jgi:hypothetical protein